MEEITVASSESSLPWRSICSITSRTAGMTCLQLLSRTRRAQLKQASCVDAWSLMFVGSHSFHASSIGQRIRTRIPASSRPEKGGSHEQLNCAILLNYSNYGYSVFTKCGKLHPGVCRKLEMPAAVVQASAGCSSCLQQPGGEGVELKFTLLVCRWSLHGRGLHSSCLQTEHA